MKISYRDKKKAYQMHAVFVSLFLEMFAHARNRYNMRHKMIQYY